MNLPSFSCICVTAGRAHFLEEAIASFVRQSYEGESELVILNTLPAQQLELGNGYDNVRIINLTERPKSLGEARNMAIALAENEWCIVWDDDDAYLPNHLSNFAARAEGNEWLWQSRQYYMLSGKIKSIVQGSANVLAFTKKAWETVGGYKQMNCGEDRHLAGRITSQCKGQRIELADDKVSFIYIWGQGTFHQSGLGDDKPGMATSWQRAENDLKRKLSCRVIPTGVVRLEPQLRHDYEGIARQFVSQLVKATGGKGSLGVVMLGKFGDCVNCLPILKRLHDRGDHPTVIVSKSFAPIFDGVSYVTPHPVAHQFEDLLPAMRLAKLKFDRVLRLQVYGRGHVQKHATSSYNQEPWAEAGMLEDFHNPELKPVFDRRNAVREQAILRKLFPKPTTRPKLITNLLYAASSPFPLGQQVLAAIKLAFRDSHDVMDISRLKLHRIYDLLAVIEQAELFISIDTAALHLAAATDTPVLALVNNTPWLGSAIRYNDVAVLPYRDATPARVVEVMRAAIGIGKQLAGIK